MSAGLAKEQVAKLMGFRKILSNLVVVICLVNGAAALAVIHLR